MRWSALRRRLARVCGSSSNHSLPGDSSKTEGKPSRHTCKVRETYDLEPSANNRYREGRRESLLDSRSVRPTAKGPLVGGVEFTPELQQQSGGFASAQRKNGSGGEAR